MSSKSKPTRLSKKTKSSSSSSSAPAPSATTSVPAPPQPAPAAATHVAVAPDSGDVREQSVDSSEEGVSRQYSRPSADAMRRLDELNGVFASLADRVGSIDSMIDPSDLSTVHRARGELAQIIGDLEKLQFKEIDAISTADLRSGKSDAAASRKMLNNEIEALQRQTTSIYHQLGAFIDAVTSSQQAQQQKAQQQQQQEVEDDAEIPEQEPTPAEAAAVAKHDHAPLTREETTKLLLLLSRAAAAGLVDPDVRKHLKSEICQQKGYLRYIVEQETIQGSLHEITEFTLPKST